MYVLYKEVGPDEWQVVGYYANQPEAICAYEEERKKEDCDRFRIKHERGNSNGEQ